MGWGESMSVSSELVRKSQERISADMMAIAIADFKKHRSSKNEQKLYLSLERYWYFRTSGEGESSEVNLILLEKKAVDCIGE